MRYPVVIHKDPDSDFGITIPDLTGCFSAGSTIEEAINMAQEAAECHIEGLLIDSEPIPTPNDIEVHKDNPDFKEGIKKAANSIDSGAALKKLNSLIEYTRIK